MPPTTPLQALALLMNQGSLLSSSNA